jgi:predicted short-subunit dehydrogenase-like oxidoreductase (DUF2520 family)
MKPSVALIGPGKLGCAVARRLHNAGYPFAALISRDQLRAQEACNFIGCETTIASRNLPDAYKAKIILLAVPDDQIESLAKSLQTSVVLAADQTLIHFSGLHPAALMRMESSAVQLLSLHPLLPFADRQRATKNLSGCPCALEGDGTALALGEQLVTAIGGTPFAIASDKKALYHTSACIAANFLVTLLGAARDLLNQCGIDREQAIPLLLPLVQASLDNTAKLGPEAGLTGPIVRGDCGTVQQHLDALETSAPELMPLYRLLAEKTVELAVKSGRLTPGQAKNLPL